MCDTCGAVKTYYIKKKAGILRITLGKFSILSAQNKPKKLPRNNTQFTCNKKISEILDSLLLY